VIIGGATALTALVLAWHVRWLSEHGSVLPYHVPWSATGFLIIIALELAGVLAFPTDPLEAGESGFAVGRDSYHWYAIIALDSLVVVGSVFLLAWVTLLEPGIRMRHLDAPGLVSNLGTTAGYLIVMTGALLLAMFRQPRSGLALALLGGGLTVMMLSTAIYLVIAAEGGHDVPAVVDVISTAGWLLVLLASLVRVPASRPPVRRGGSPRIVWLRSALPYLALGAAGVLVFGQLLANGSLGRIERTGLICLLILALIRQLATMGENTRLLSSVEQSRQELHFQALHDPLTGLANRALFTDRLAHALAFRDSRSFALVFCDLDDFKRVNDTLGHAAGDELLKTTATRLRAGVRPGDTVARLGGDEFALLLEDGHDDPAAVARRLAATIRSPTTLAGHSQPVGASFGLVIAAPDRQPDAEALLRDADLAMYAAKRQGKGGLVVYQPELAVSESAPQLRTDLERALGGDDQYGIVEVRYGPVIDLRTGTLRAVDAVPRWSHGHRGEIAPDLLDRLADEAGLRMPLLGVVLQQVCRDLAAQGPPHAAPVFVRIPVSRDLEGTPVAGVVRLLADDDLPPHAIILTLAVTSGLADLTAAAPVLQRVADGGVRLALDEVGGDVGAFAAWRTVPIQIIRLDPAFTDVDATPVPQRTRLAREAAIAAAARLEVTVVATGIDDPGQARELAGAGCHLGTGPLYGTPRPLGELSPATERAYASASAGVRGRNGFPRDGPGGGAHDPPAGSTAGSSPPDRARRRAAERRQPDNRGQAGSSR
jgi:diguanylate cyclase (GGDEF)-like protein